MSIAKFKALQDDGIATSTDSRVQDQGVLGPGASLPAPGMSQEAISNTATEGASREGQTPGPEMIMAADSRPDENALDPLRGDRNESTIKVLIARLSDLLFLPSGNMSPQERALSDDLISRLFEKADRTSKLKLVERMLGHTEPPAALIRTMLHSEDEVALPILRSPLRLNQADLISVVMTSGPLYQKCVAEREDLRSAVCDAIIQCADVMTIRVMLRNMSTEISRTGFVRLAEKSLEAQEVLEPLIDRADFPADIAHLVFWWSPSDLRKRIIERFASSRQTIFEVVSPDITEDFNEMMPEVANAFSMVRKARKMDRHDVDLALDELENGDANQALDMLAAGAFLEPETIAQIFDDRGGEAVGVFCKAIGFGRERFERLCKILSERVGEVWTDDGAATRPVNFVYDSLSTDKADLILRYWDRATREIEN